MNLSTRILPFGKKAKESIRNNGYLTVWEGSVRSMKTVVSLWGFLLYVISSDEQTFLMTGATQGSLYRNCISNEFGLIELSNNLLEDKTDKNNSKYLHLKGTNKKIYYFGGETVSSYKPIRGQTYAGWYADEVNKQHRNTINEGFNRTVVSTDRKNFWTLNPDVPNHWIYKDFIDKYKKINLEGYRWYHFTLEDNPAITAERRAELARQYTGVFYQRFILGLRVSAEGAIYTEFDDSRNIKVLPPGVKVFTSTIGGDIGGNKSATALTHVLFFYQDNRLHVHARAEDYDSENISTESILDRFETFSKFSNSLYFVENAFIDSAEQLIIKSMRNKGIVPVKGSKKIAIIDRIRLIKVLLSQGRLTIDPSCKNLIDALKSAVWKEGTQERLDDGTTNIDSLDSIEYAIERKFKELII